MGLPAGPPAMITLFLNRIRCPSWGRKWRHAEQSYWLEYSFYFPLLSYECHNPAEWCSNKGPCASSCYDQEIHIGWWKLFWSHMMRYCCFVDFLLSHPVRKEGGDRHWAKKINLICRPRAKITIFLASLVISPSLQLCFLLPPNYGDQHVLDRFFSPLENSCFFSSAQTLSSHTQKSQYPQSDFLPTIFYPGDFRNFLFAKIWFTILYDFFSILRSTPNEKLS